MCERVLNQKELFCLNKVVDDKRSVIDTYVSLAPVNALCVHEASKVGRVTYSLAAPRSVPQMAQAGDMIIFEVDEVGEMLAVTAGANEDVKALLAGMRAVQRVMEVDER